MAQFSVACCSSPADGVAGSVLLQVDGEKGPKVASALGAMLVFFLVWSVPEPESVWACYTVPVQRSRRFR